VKEGAAIGLGTVLHQIYLRSKREERRGQREPGEKLRGSTQEKMPIQVIKDEGKF